jgi:hypothetical protein
MLDELFISVRDIPFQILLQSKNEATQIAYLLNRNSGGCTAKHCYLGRVLHSLGLQVKYLDFPFFWHEQVNLPEYLRDMAINLPPTHHLTFEVSFSEKHLFIDASWDYGLSSVFNVNDPPFAANLNCANAVVPHDEPAEYWDVSQRYSANNDAVYFASADKNLPFYSAFNDYLARIRVASFQS